MCDVVKLLRDRLTNDSVISNGAGNYSIWAHRFFKYRQFGNQLAPTSGSMGYGLPAAIAAASVDPGKTIVALAGDGCFMMTCQEFSTAVQYGLNLVVIVVNNSMYGTIRMHQEKRFPARVSGTNLKNPNFAEMANAMGGLGVRVSENTAFEKAFDQALDFKGPALIEILLDSQAITPVQTIDELRG